MMEDLFPCIDFTPEPTSLALGKLPLELLDAIASFVPQKSLPNFALVHSQCRAVAIRHMYATVILRASYFSVRPKDGTEALPSPTLSVPELLSLVTIHGSPMLRRLLANDEHIACLREFRIERYPNSENRPFFTAFVKHIWSTAKALTTVNHEFYPSSPSALPGPCWPSTLQQLDTKHICWWTVQALREPPMRRLRLQNCTRTIDKLYANELSHITQFEYQWHEWKGEFEDFNFDWIARVFPNLTKLRIGVCACWEDQGIPDKIYESALCRLVGQLPSLHTFTIGEASENAPLAEESFAVSLSRSQPPLREIRFEWRQGNAVSWQCHGSEDDHEKRERTTNQTRKKDPQTRWTPDPTYRGRHAWWFGRFGLPEASRPAMVTRWPELVLDIYTERELYDQVFALVKAELMLERSCEWEMKGSCDCAMCAF